MWCAPPFPSQRPIIFVRTGGIEKNLCGRNRICCRSALPDSLPLGTLGPCGHGDAFHRPWGSRRRSRARDRRAKRLLSLAGIGDSLPSTTPETFPLLSPGTGRGNREGVRLCDMGLTSCTQVGERQECVNETDENSYILPRRYSICRISNFFK